MEVTILDCLLGKFRPYYDRGCNFARIVHLTLVTAEMCEANGDLDRAKVHYSNLMDYLEAVAARSDIREREFAELPTGRFLRANVRTDMENIIQEYFAG